MPLVSLSDKISKEEVHIFQEVLWVSVSQRAAKLLSVKLWWWSHCPGIEPGPLTYGLTPTEQQDSFRSTTLATCSFAVLWPTETHNKKTSGIFKTDFALSKWPNLHRAYLVISPYSSSETVYGHQCIPHLICVWSKDDSGQIIAVDFIFFALNSLTNVLFTFVA